METKHEDIRLADIVVSESNKMFRDEAELSATALHELVESIKEHGVIQPILVRPLKKGYELVCGERRYRASNYAGMKDIPATIRELTNDEAFSLQVMENLQRKDVHPLKESFAYKYLVDKDSKANTPAELALRFGKTEHYIHTRLKLNDLLPEARKDFAEGLMTIGHALLIARLTPTDQKEVVRQMSSSYQKGKGEKVKYYESIHDLEELINDDIICNLNTAAFRKDDPTLLPKAGTCLACPKRSGASQLFADEKDKDRCFDRACFLEKRVKFMATQIPSLLEKEPDLAYLQSSRGNSKVDPSVEKILKDHKVKILKPNSDYNTYDYSGHAKIKGIYINGDEVGKKAVVFSATQKASSKSSAKAGPDKADPKEAIARINERLERGKELDQEKIYNGVIELLETNKAVDELDISLITQAEYGLVAQIIYNSADFQTSQLIDKKLGLSKLKKESEISLKLKQIGQAPSHLLWMVRTIAYKQYSSVYHHDKSEGILITEMARAYAVPVSELIKSQEAVRLKREENAAKRKRELQPKKVVKKSVAKPSRGDSYKATEKKLIEAIPSYARSKSLQAVLDND